MAFKVGEYIGVTVASAWAEEVGADRRFHRFSGEPGIAPTYGVEVVSMIDSEGLWVRNSAGAGRESRMVSMIPWGYILLIASTPQRTRVSTGFSTSSGAEASEVGWVR